MYKLSDFREILMEQAVCNFHCKYCHSGFGDNSNCHSRLLSFDKDWWDKNVEKDYVEHMGIWGGEPFANFKQLDEIVNYLDPYVGTFTIITNGSLIDIDKIKWCIEHRVRLHFSHDLSDQDIRGKDFLQNDKFWEAMEYMKDNFVPVWRQPEWKISLQKVLHEQTSSFSEDLKYIETLPKGYKYNFSFAIQRGENMPDEYVWNSDKILSYLSEVLDYIYEKGEYAKFIYMTFIKRHFRCYMDIPTKFTCRPMQDLADGKMKSIGLSGNLYFCHANNEFDKGVKIKDKCNSCKWAKACMGACAVMNHKVPCEEWELFYEKWYQKIDEFVNKIAPDTPRMLRPLQDAVGNYLGRNS